MLYNINSHFAECGSCDHAGFYPRNVGATQPLSVRGGQSSIMVLELEVAIADHDSWTFGLHASGSVKKVIYGCFALGKGNRFHEDTTTNSCTERLKGVQQTCHVPLALGSIERRGDAQVLKRSSKQQSIQCVCSAIATQHCFAKLQPDA